jgi:hypothetical protein
MDAPRIPDDFELIEWIYNYRRRVQYIEREYLDLRIRLRDTKSDLRSDSKNRDLKAKVDQLKSRLKDLEKRHPWVSTGRPSEIAFCITPSGGI